MSQVYGESRESFSDLKKKNFVSDMKRNSISGAVLVVLSASVSLLVMAVYWGYGFMERSQVFTVLGSPYGHGTKSRVDCFNEFLISAICVYENVIIRNG
jgi:hypothetical protein